MIGGSSQAEKTARLTLKYDAHFEDKTAGKVGGWIFWVDESKKLETVNEDTRVGLLEDPDGNKIDMSETGLYLRIPQCNSSNKDEK